MNNLSTNVDASQTIFGNGRKRISYDWQRLDAAAEAASLDGELAARVPALAA